MLKVVAAYESKKTRNIIKNQIFFVNEQYDDIGYCSVTAYYVHYILPLFFQYAGRILCKTANYN